VRFEPSVPVLNWWRSAPRASWPARSAERYRGPWNAFTANPILVIRIRLDHRQRG
jgi:hypothetical protein